MDFLANHSESLNLFSVCCRSCWAVRCSAWLGWCVTLVLGRNRLAVVGITKKEQENVYKMHSSGQLGMVSYLPDAFLELSWLPRSLCFSSWTSCMNWSNSVYPLAVLNSVWGQILLIFPREVSWYFSVQMFSAAANVIRHSRKIVSPGWQAGFIFWCFQDWASLCKTPPVLRGQSTVSSAQVLLIWEWILGVYIMKLPR